MAKKSFQTVPKPKNQLSQANIEAFEQGGAGQDKNPQNHKTANVGNNDSGKTKRLSVDISVQTHTRFKTACSATGRKMTKEIESFIEKRTLELEKEI